MRFLRFLAPVARLTRGMSCLLRCARRALQRREHLLQPLRVAGRYERGLAESALPLRRLLGQDVLFVALRAHQLSRAGLLEALRRAAMGLHLRHVRLPDRLARSSLPTPRPRSRPPPGRLEARPCAPARPPRGWAPGSSIRSGLPSAADSRPRRSARAARPPGRAACDRDRDGPARVRDTSPSP